MFIDDKKTGLAHISTAVIPLSPETGWPCSTCGRTVQEPDTLCPVCQEAYNESMKRTAIERQTTRLGGSKAYNQFVMDKFTNKEAIKKCDGYPNINLFLWGKAGTGKTHLATALVRGQNGIVVKPQHIYRAVRGLKDGSAEQAAINKYVYIPHLVIDDLGVDKKTDFSFSTLFEIIEGRDMNNMAGLIVTSNLSLSDLAERLGDDRIPSRLSGMCRVIQLTGIDHRIETHKPEYDFEIEKENQCPMNTR